jgi:hypothetical protein
MSAIMNVWIPQKYRKLSAIWATISFSRRTCSVVVEGRRNLSYVTSDRATSDAKVVGVALMTECYIDIACWVGPRHLRICSNLALPFFFANHGIFFIRGFLCIYTWKWWLPRQVIHICWGQVAVTSESIFMLSVLSLLCAIYSHVLCFISKVFVSWFQDLWTLATVPISVNLNFS